MKFLNAKTWLLALMAIILFGACKKDPPVPVVIEPSEAEQLKALNLALGNPSNAAKDPSMEENYLLEYNQFALSYSRSRGIPNWVSWYLNEEWLGDTERTDDFRQDHSLPSGWYKVDAGDYDFYDNGFHRGHNCPSADRTSSVTDNSRTFLMTNIIPQAPDHNQDTWADIESYSRSLAKNGNELYIIMGNHGKGGIGNEGFKETIDNGRITVPKFIWKIIVVLPDGEDDLTRINEDTRVIGILTQNTNSADDFHWGGYRVSVDVIEALTGYDFLSNVADDVEAVIENKVDDMPL